MKFLVLFALVAVALAEDLSSDANRHTGHWGGRGSWGGHGGWVGAKRWRREADLVAIVDDELAVAENRWGGRSWGGNRWGGPGHVVVSGHRGGHRWRRDVDLNDAESNLNGWTGRTWGVPSHSRVNLWNRGNVWSTGNSWKRW